MVMGAVRGSNIWWAHHQAPWKHLFLLNTSICSLFLHFFGCVCTRNSINPFMAPQSMWEIEFYQLRPHKPSSSKSADHTNLVVRTIIPLYHPDQNFTKLLLISKRMQDKHSSTPAVSPSPLSQSDFAEIRGVTNDDSQARTSRRQGKNPCLQIPAGRKM